MERLDFALCEISWLHLWTQSRRVFVAASFIVAPWDGKTGWAHSQGGASNAQVRRTDSSKCKYVSTTEIQTETHLKAARTTHITPFWHCECIIIAVGSEFQLLFPCLFWFRFVWNLNIRRSITVYIIEFLQKKDKNKWCYFKGLKSV